MKKNLLIGFLTIVSILSLTYGYLQKKEAERQAALAIRSITIAEEMKVLAEKSRKEADLARMMAIANEKRVIEQMAAAEKASSKAKSK